MSVNVGFMELCGARMRKCTKHLLKSGAQARKCRIKRVYQLLSGACVLEDQCYRRSEGLPAGHTAEPNAEHGVPRRGT